MAKTKELKLEINGKGVPLVANKTIEAISFSQAEEISKTFKKYDSVSWLSVPKDVFEVCSPEACLLYSHLLGFANGLYKGSNTALANLMHCSTRTISRLLNELQVKNCIRVIVVNRQVRLLYPVYTLPFILVTEPSSKKSSKSLENEKMEEL